MKPYNGLKTRFFSTIIEKSSNIKRIFLLYKIPNLIFLETVATIIPVISVSVVICLLTNKFAAINFDIFHQSHFLSYLIPHIIVYAICLYLICQYIVMIHRLRILKDSLELAEEEEDENDGEIGAKLTKHQAVASLDSIFFNFIKTRFFIIFILTLFYFFLDKNSFSLNLHTFSDYVFFLLSFGILYISLLALLELPVLIVFFVKFLTKLLSDANIYENRMSFAWQDAKKSSGDSTIDA